MNKNLRTLKKTLSIPDIISVCIFSVFLDVGNLAINIPKLSDDVLVFDNNCTSRIFYRIKIK